MLYYSRNTFRTFCQEERAEVATHGHRGARQSKPAGRRRWAGRPGGALYRGLFRQGHVSVNRAAHRTLSTRTDEPSLVDTPAKPTPTQYQTFNLLPVFDSEKVLPSKHSAFHFHSLGVGWLTSVKQCTSLETSTTANTTWLQTVAFVFVHTLHWTTIAWKIMYC